MCGVYGSTWGPIYSWGGIQHHWGETGERDVAVALHFVLIEERRKNGEWRRVPGLINTFFSNFPASRAPANTLTPDRTGS